MTEHGFSESVVERAALAWLEAIGWPVAHGPGITLDMPAAEPCDYTEVVLAQHVCDALLPKLFSGERRVKDAERFLKERGL